MLKLWEMQNIPSLLSHSGPLKPEVVAHDKGPIYGSNRTKLWFQEFTVFAFNLHIYAKQNCLDI